MIFSSLLFIFLFLPLLFILYVPKNKVYRNIILLVFSLVFYTWGEGERFLLLIYTSLVCYFGGRIISRNKSKKVLWVFIILILWQLIYFKYFNFLAGIYIDIVFMDEYPIKNMALPVGISFFTFQGISYLYDVYTDRTKHSDSLLNLTLYISLFPQLIAGPIVRYTSIEKELKNRNISLDGVYNGSRRFIIGLGKHVIIAGTLGHFTEGVLNENLSEIPFSVAWLTLITYTFQIYFDFSGYSDMAIGLGRIFGFNFPENFNLPYISKGFREFWRRWHISLSQWFRDYIYIPLGGNKKGVRFHYRNLIIVFLLTGFWHGASWNFILWGALHGFFMLIERSLNWEQLNIHPLLKNAYCFFFVMLLWVPFMLPEWKDTEIFFSSLTGLNENAIDPGYYFDVYQPFTFIVLAFSIIAAFGGFLKVSNYFNSEKKIWVSDIALIAVFIFCVITITASTSTPFIYFRF